MERGNALGATLPQGQGTDGPQGRIAQLLGVISAKDKTARFLLGLQKAFERLGATDPVRQVPR